MKANLPFLSLASHDMPSVQCPACDMDLNMATSVGAEGSPEPGGVTICIGCGTVMVFTERLTLRELTAAERTEIEENAAFRRLLDATQRSVIEYGRGKRRCHA